MSRRYVLLDRDGTLIVERHYLADPEGVELLPGVVDGLRRMHGLGLGLIVVTNQSGIAKGYFTPTQLEAIHARLGQCLRAHGLELDGIYCCPHDDADGCACRKPKTGLIQRAAAEHGFRPGECFLIGDKTIDILCGKNAGARTILVRTGYGAEVEQAGACGADAIVDDLAAAAEYIGQVLARDEQPGRNS